MTQRVSLQARYHPEVVFLHPDLSISLGTENKSFGIGLGLDNPFRLPDAYRVTRKLHKGYQPIVESEWVAGALTVRHTALTILPHDEETVNGKETQYLVVHVSVSNTSANSQTSPLILTPQAVAV